MKYWVTWVVVLAIYGALNFLCVWAGEKPGLASFFLWGTTLPVTAIITWGAILIPRRVTLPSKRILGLLTALVYGGLGIASFLTIMNSLGSA